jgi:hypothetical protein
MQARVYFMRAIVMLYGLISYLLFFGVFLYFIAFNAEILVPKTLSSAADGQLGKNVILALLGCSTHCYGTALV